jgi:hypothetical protein
MILIAIAWGHVTGLGEAHKARFTLAIAAAPVCVPGASPTRSWPARPPQKKLKNAPNMPARPKRFELFESRGLRRDLCRAAMSPTGITSGPSLPAHVTLCAM